MKIFLRNILFCLVYFSPQLATAGLFETGILKDQAAYIDAGSKAKVEMVMNIMGTENPKTGKTDWTQRYVLVFVPLEKKKIKKIKVFSPDGQPINMSLKPQLYEPYNAGIYKTGIKLYLIKQAGFEFKMVID